MRQQLLLHIAHRTPQAVPRLRVQFFQPPEDVGDVRAPGVVLVGAGFQLGGPVAQAGQGGDVRLVHQAERADKGDGELAHPEQRRHGGEGALVGEVHQQRLQDVVHVVPQGNLVAFALLRQGEKRLAAIPRAEEAGRLAGVARGVERRFHHVQGDAQAAAEVVEEGGVRAVADVGHHHVCRLHLEAGMPHAAPGGQQFGQGEGILATGQGHKDAVALVDKPVVRQTFLEAAAQAGIEFFFGCFHK